MKKLLFALIATSSLLLAHDVKADAAVFLTNFGNSGSIADTPIYLSNGTTLAPSFFVEILGGASAGSLSPIAAIAGGATVFTQNSGDGFFDFGTGVITGLPDQSLAFFQVRAWTGAADFNSATVRGSSTVFSQLTGKGPTAQPSSPGTPAVLDIPGNGIVLASVPEPTTIALGVMGGMALLARRRRNAKA